MGWLRWGWRGAAAAAIVAVTLLAGAAGARAADVSFTCCSYSPDAVRIAPGASVTWNGDFSQHPLHARDGESETFGPVGGGSTFTHAYPSAGVFHYFCMIHGASQTSGMIGTVVVTANQPPLAALSGPASAPVGTSVTWDASGSSDPDGVVAHYEWDLDGNGTYETDTGFMPTVSRTYPSTGSFTVRVRVTDNNADAVGPESAVASRVLSVTPAAGTGGSTSGSGGSGSGSGAGGGTGSTTPASGTGAGGGSGSGSLDGGGTAPATTPTGSSGGGAGATSLVAPARIRLATLRAHGLAVRVRGPRSGTARATLLVHKRVVASGSARVVSGRSIPLRLRVTRRGRHALAGVRRASATLSVVLPGRSKPLTRRVLLRR